MSENKRKVRKVVRLKDEEEFEKEYVKFVETPIQDTGDFIGSKRRIAGAKLFINPATGKEILPLARSVKCRCGRKFRIWLASRDPQVWAGRCPRCKGEHYVGDTDAIGKADRKQEKEWLRRAKQTKKKKRW